MIISESSLKRAIETFIHEACIPRPGSWKGKWSAKLDGTFLNRLVVPAFLKALEEIEEVRLCHGFDIDRVQPNL